MSKRRLEQEIYLPESDDNECEEIITPDKISRKHTQIDIYGRGEHENRALYKNTAMNLANIDNTIELEKPNAEIERILKEPEIIDVQLQNPFTILLTGKSGCGKTVWVENLLNKWKQVTDDEAGKFLKIILWFYGAEQTDLFDRLKNKFGKEHIEFIEGIDEKCLAEVTNCIVIMDDLMSEMRNNVAVAELFTKSSHQFCERTASVKPA